MVATDTSGNVGLGTSGSGYRFATSGSTQLLSGCQFTYAGVGVGTLTITSNASMAFGLDGASGSTERMRIDSSGNLQIGTATAGAIVPAMSIVRGGTTWQLGPSVPTGGGNTFYVLNSSNIGVYLTSGGTSWTASSDERLKTDLKPIENAADKVATLRAVTGRFKTDDEGTSRSFLIAQDVQAVLPEAVNVQDDEQGTLGVQYTDVIPLLVAAIKELKAIVDTQAEQIKALQGVA
jgi:hypothetical protein